MWLRAHLQQLEEEQTPGPRINNLPAGQAGRAGSCDSWWELRYFQDLFDTDGSNRQRVLLSSALMKWKAEASGEGGWRTTETRSSGYRSYTTNQTGLAQYILFSPIFLQHCGTFSHQTRSLQFSLAASFLFFLPGSLADNASKKSFSGAFRFSICVTTGRDTQFTTLAKPQKTVCSHFIYSVSDILCLHVIKCFIKLRLSLRYRGELYIMVSKKTPSVSIGTTCSSVWVWRASECS